MKKTMKRILAMMLVVVMTIGAAPLSGFVGLELPDMPEFTGLKKLASSVSDFFDSFAPKAEAVTSGKCGDNITWTFDESTGTLTISGTGEMNDYWSDSVPWCEYRSTVKKIVLSDGITSIGNYSFYGLINITSVTFPDSITKIGWHAFGKCSAISNLNIPNGVTSIGENAFEGCSALSDIIIPNSVTSIGSNVFWDTKYYKNSSNWKDSVLYIGGFLIQAKTSKSGVVTVREGTSIIADSAFGVCKQITGIIIPESVKSIGRGAFSGCTSLSSVSIGDGVVDIGAYAFKDCDKLNAITIPGKVKNIGMNAFSYCDKLTTVSFSNSVKFIDSSAFYQSKQLSEVYYSGSVADWCGIEFSAPTSNPLFYAKKLYIDGELISGDSSITSGELLIPEEVKNIGSYAFYRCSDIVNITIHDEVESIGTNAFYETGYYNDKTNWKKGALYVDKYLVRFDQKMSGAYSVNDGTIIIADSAFMGCGINSITIPDSLKFIGEDAYLNCNKLTDVYYKGNQKEWDKIIIGLSNDYLLNAKLHFIKADLTFKKDEYIIGKGYDFIIKGELTAEVDDISKIDLSYTVSDPTGLTVISDSMDIISDDKAEFAVKIKGLKEGEYTLTVTDGIVSESCVVKVSEISEIELKTEDTEDVFYEYNNFLFDQFGNYAQNGINIDIQLRNKLKDGVDIFSLDSETLANAKIENVRFVASVSDGYAFNSKITKNTYEKIFDVIEFNTTKKNPIKIYRTKDAPETLTIKYELYIDNELKHTHEDEIKVLSYKVHYMNEHIDAVQSPRFRTLLDVSFAQEMISAEDTLGYKWNTVIGRSLFSNIYDLVEGDLSEQMAYEMLIADLVGKMYDDEMISAKSIEIFGNEYTSVCNKIVDILMNYCKHYEPALFDILNEIGEGDLYGQALIAFMRGERGNNFAVVFEEAFKSTQLREEIKSSLKIMSATDKLMDIFDVADIAIDSYNGCVKAFNLVSALNTFSKMDKEIVTVLESMLAQCKDNQPLKRAISSFINYYNSDDRLGDIANEFRKSNMDVITKTAWSLLKKIYKDSVKEAFISGVSKLFGETFAGHAASVIGGALSGYEFGSLLSNLLCNTNKCADIMAKVVAVGRFSEVLEDTVFYLAGKLGFTNDYQCARDLDMALNLYVEAEKYAYEETINALEAEGSSTIINLFCKGKHDDYIEQISEYIVKISKLGSLKCHSDNLARIAADISQLESGASDYSIEEKEYKVVCVRCPVDVEIRKGKDILVSIVDNKTKYCAENIHVVIFEGEKYICMPADAEYDVSITATDNGTMNYDVYEFDKSGENVRGVAYNNIGISDGQKFNGSVNSELLTDSSNYNLTSNGKEISASKDTENGDVILHETQIKIGSEEIIRNVPVSIGLVYTNLPENSRVIWSSDSQSVVIKPAEDGMSCEIIAGKVEDFDVTATVEYGSEKLVAKKTFKVKEQDFKVTWKIGEEKSVQNVEYGKSIIAPEVTLPEGYIFIGWGKEIPDTMPAYDLVFRAVIETDPNYHFHTVKTVTVPATCTEDGVEYDICETCGEKLTEDIILPATGHTPGSWVTSISPSCTEDGEKIIHCTVCDVIITSDIIPATGHFAGTWTVTKEATCTTEGERIRKCLYCGEVMETEKIPVTAHTPGNWIVSVNPTCTETGEKTRKCSGCGKVLEISEVPATGHTVGSWIMVLEPTETTEGKEIRKCTVCKVTLEERTIPVVENKIEAWIKSPSKTTISYGDSIILHAEANGVLPKGYSYSWMCADGKFAVEPNGDTCKITPAANGNSTITLILSDDNGNPVSTDEQTMTSKAGFFYKIIAFFKGIFGLNKTYPNVFKGIF